MTKAIQSVHPLVAKEDLTYFRRWEEWKKLWDEEKRVELLHSLLHFGFNVETTGDQHLERICLYLEVADGHCRPWGRLEKDGEEGLSVETALGRFSRPRDLRGAIAKKAFQILCQNLFRDTDDSYDDCPRWYQPLTTPRVLPKLLWFFRLDERQNRLLNLIPSEADSDNHTRVAYNFLLDFCSFTWEPRRHEHPTNPPRDESFNRLKAVRPQLIAILCALGRLDLLLRKGWEFDEADLLKLRKLAMSEELWLPVFPSMGHRLPQTLEESVFGGSQAARVLLLLENNRREEERLAKMMELERQRRAAERELQRLEGGRKTP